jgi:hypothetical protein
MPASHFFRRWWHVLAMLVTAGLLGGCTIPASVHPLSDNKTSKVDTRLIGRWVAIEEDEETEPGEAREKTIANQDLYTVGLRKSSSNTMKLIYVELDDDGEVTVEKSIFFTTSIDKQHYLSWQAKEEKKIVYVIAAYDLDANSVLTVWVMDNNKIVKAIEQGRVDGEIKITVNEKDGKKVESKTAHLTAKPELLRRFLHETGLDCFDKEHPMKYQFLGR